MIKIILGLLIWVILPAYLNTKRVKTKTMKKAVAKVCAIGGFAAVAWGVYDIFLKEILY